MGLVDTLLDSIVVVVAGLFGFGMLITGSQQAATGNGGFGIIIGLIGIILLVFATRQ